MKLTSIPTHLSFQFFLIIQTVIPENVLTKKINFTEYKFGFEIKHELV
jgi:hypothetical protein